MDPDNGHFGCSLVDINDTEDIIREAETVLREVMNENGNGHVSFGSALVDLNDSEDIIREAETVMREVMNGNRLNANQICAEMSEIPAQLEELLNNLYECAPNEKDFSFNSTIPTTETDLFTSPSTASDFNMHTSTGSLSTQCTSRETCNSSDSSFFVTADSSPYVQNSSCYATTTCQATNNTELNQSNSSFVLNTTADNSENFLDFLVDPKTYQAQQTVAISQVSDPSPVYVNFNVQNTLQPENQSEFFSVNYEHFESPDAPTQAQNINESFNYMDYLNTIEEVWQPNAVATNGEQDKDQPSGAILNNDMPAATQMICPIQNIYNFPEDLDTVNDTYVTQIMTPCQQIPNAMTQNGGDQTQPTTPLYIQRNIISRRPLQTRLSIKRNNLEWAIINENKKASNNPTEDLCPDNELMQIQQFDPDIPFIKEYRTSGRKTRKQALNPLTDDGMSFTSGKGEGGEIEANVDTCSLDAKPQTDTDYVTLRKKRKKQTISSPSKFGESSAGRSSREPFDTSTTTSINVSTILISSESESDEEQDESKCLKCFQCKKSLKSARSFAIHRKRCTASKPAVANTSTPPLVDAESCESDKHEYRAATDPSDSKDVIFLDETIELVESDSLESLEFLQSEPMPESPKYSDERVVSRNTRSSSHKTRSSQKVIQPTADSPVAQALNRPSTRNSNKNNNVSVDSNSCEICGKKFRTKGCLIVHKRVHEKNFKCPYCLKVFQVKPAYDTHILEKCDKIPSLELKRLRSVAGKKDATRLNPE